MFLSYKDRKDKSEILDLINSDDIVTLSNEIPDNISLLFHGDNITALTSLINSKYKGNIDLIYIDPPYNTGQQFVIHNGRASAISRTKDNNAKVAYNDDKFLHEYIEFMRERLFLMRELLSEKGSIYVHIDNKVGHYLKIIMDEIFGIQNFKNDISRIKSNPKNFGRKAFGNEKDMILFYAKNSKKNIFNDITIPLSDNEKLSMFKKLDSNGRRYNTIPVHAPGETINGETGKEWRGMLPPSGRHWRVSPDELEKLNEQNLIEWSANGVPRLKKFADEHKGKKIQDVWVYKDPAYPLYPTEKNRDMLEMIILQSSNPDSIVLDCFAGSGSTLKAAEKLGRKWIGVDMSSSSIDVIKSSINELNPLNYQIINLPQYHNR